MFNIQYECIDLDEDPSEEEVFGEDLFVEEDEMQAEEKDKCEEEDEADKGGIRVLSCYSLADDYPPLEHYPAPCPAPSPAPSPELAKMLTQLQFRAKSHTNQLFLPVSSLVEAEVDGLEMAELVPALESRGLPLSQHLLWSDWTVTHLSLTAARLALVPGPGLARLCRQARPQASVVRLAASKAEVRVTRRQVARKQAGKPVTREKWEVGPAQLTLQEEQEKELELRLARDVFSISGIRPVRKFPDPPSPRHTQAAGHPTVFSPAPSPGPGFQLSRVPDPLGTDTAGWFTGRLAALALLSRPRPALTSGSRPVIHYSGDAARIVELAEYLTARQGGVAGLEGRAVVAGAGLPPGWLVRVGQQQVVSPAGALYPSVAAALAHNGLGRGGGRRSRKQKPASPAAELINLADSSEGETAGDSMPGSNPKPQQKALTEHETEPGLEVKEKVRTKIAASLPRKIPVKSSTFKAEQLPTENKLFQNKKPLSESALPQDRRQRTPRKTHPLVEVENKVKPKMLKKQVGQEAGQGRRRGLTAEQILLALVADSTEDQSDDRSN